MARQRDWNKRYADGDTPWDTGEPSEELIRVIAERNITPCRVLETGCGTGADAVYLAQQGFKVTAFDLSPLAIQRAKQRAEQAGVVVRFFEADIANRPEIEGPFQLVFDRGCYHCVHQEHLDELLGLLDSVLPPGCLWLMQVGNANDPHPVGQGPPRLTATEICTGLEPLFELIELREFFFDSSAGPDRFQPMAWSVVSRRRSGSSASPTGLPRIARG